MVAKTDNKEIQQTQHELERAQKMYQSIFNIARDIISLTTVDGITASLNPIFEKITGHSIADYIGRPFIDLVHPDDIPFMINLFTQATQNVEIPMWECRISKKDGDWVYLENWTMPWFEDGQLTAFLSFSRDITERKRIDEMRAAAQAADAANKAKSIFLAHISHEIRTPLGIILGFAELGMELPDSAEKTSYFEKIKSNGDHLMNVINEILDLSKVESGRMEIAFSSFSIEHVTRSIITALNDTATKKNLQLKLRKEGGVPETIHSDEKRVRQILINLLGNAIKFTSQGSIEVVLSTSANQKQVVIDIIDTGIGISPEDAMKLFIPFNQVDASISRRFGGTGIGLTLARQFARALGGDIELTASAPGKGSTFSVKLKI